MGDLRAKKRAPREVLTPALRRTCSISARFAPSLRSDGRLFPRFEAWLAQNTGKADGPASGSYFAQRNTMRTAPFLALIPSIALSFVAIGCTVSSNNPSANADAAAPFPATNPMGDT